MHAWTVEEKNQMRRVFEHGLRHWPTMVKCLHAVQGTLTIRAQKASYRWESIAEFDLELVRLADAQQWDRALERMAERLHLEMLRLWPECSLEIYQLFLKEHSARRAQ